MRIRVLHNYGGALTNNERILPAVYEENDPALFGQAAYLVENGHAEMVDGTPSVDLTDVQALTDELSNIPEAGESESVDPSLPEENVRRGRRNK